MTIKLTENGVSTTQTAGTFAKDPTKLVTIKNTEFERFRVPVDAPEEIDLLLAYMDEQGGFKALDTNVTCRQIVMIEAEGDDEKPRLKGGVRDGRRPS